MLDFHNISKSYGGRDILKNVNIRINTGERVGVVGPNGAGKSTLFAIAAGEISPDAGSVSIPRDHRLGIMRQTVPHSEMSRTLLEFAADAIPELKEMSRELADIEKRLNEDSPDGDALASLLNRHGELQSRIEHLGAYRLDQEAAEALSNLGFPVDSFDRPLAELSGGWQMRAALARVLISHPDTLLLDEPSNYLDVPAVEYLCRFLNGFPGTLVLISHDRFLLRKLTRVTLEVNAGTVTRYAGNYDFYKREREARMAHLEAEKRNTDRRIGQMERVIDRFRAKSTKAAAAKSMQKKLDKIEVIELPDALNYHGVLRFPPVPPTGTEAFRLEKLTFGYTPDKLLFRDLDLDVAAHDKLAVVGYNGMGKTTLLKLVAGYLKPLSGRVVPGHHTVIGYQAQEFSDVLADEMSVYDAVRAALPAGASTAGVNNVLGAFGFGGDEGKKPCGVLSGGEKIRLQFARIFVNPPNLLILDEPTTHLDVAARELLQQALTEYKGTVCMVSHDIEFIRAVATTILAVTPEGTKKYYGNYDYYLEKSRSEAPVSADAPAPRISAGADSNGPMLARDRRRERARQRQAIAGDFKRAKERVAELEARMETDAEKRKVLLAKLSSGMKIDFAGVNRELAALEKDIAEAEAEWETAMTELEALRLENERIHS
jgi:ATP-binding cassette subfamily F protein 3